MTTTAPQKITGTDQTAFTRFGIGVRSEQWDQHNSVKSRISERSRTWKAEINLAGQKKGRDREEKDSGRPCNRPPSDRRPWL